MAKWNPDKAYASVRWRRLRKMQLKKEPLCAFCLKAGKTTVADVVDHIEPHEGEERLMWDTNNLQSLCATCHSGTKRIEDVIGYSQSASKNGMPLDPKHPWNKKG